MSLLYTLFALFLCAPISLAQTPEEPGTQIQIFYTGQSMGIGSGQYTFDLPKQLSAPLLKTGVEIEHADPFHGVLVQGEFRLIAEDKKVASLVSLLQGEVQCDEPQIVWHLATHQELLFVSSPTLPPWSEKLTLEGETATKAFMQRCKANGQRALLFSDNSHLKPIWNLEEFEFRLGLHLTLSEGGVRQNAYSVGIPKNEGARRFHRLQELLEENPGSIFVDAGSFVDGNSSVRNDALSLHRPIGFDMLQRLKPAALVPGLTELAGGATPFLEEAREAALPYVATNWSTTREDLVFPKVLEKTIQTESGFVTIAFLGVLEPSLNHRIHQLKGEDVTITDPAAAVQAEVDKLRARPAPPNVIAVLTTAQNETINALRRDTTGVDVILGDPTQSISRIRQLEWQLREQDGNKAGSSAVLPMQDILSAQLLLRGPPQQRYLAQISAEPERVPDSVPPDPEVMKRVTQIRATEYPLLDKPLVPASPDAPLEPLSQATWSRIVCESIREETRADVVLLAGLPDGDAIPGAQTELLTVNRLALRDRLEIHWIPGERMNWLLLKLNEKIDIACGAPLGKKSSKTRGRSIEGQRLYRVVTTDRARQTTPLGGLIKGAYSPFLMDKPGFRVLHNNAHQPLTLREATLSALRRNQRRAGPTQNYLPALLKRSPNDIPPMWLARLRRVSLKMERFKGADSEAYSSVPETKVTSPSSFTLGTDIDASLDYSSKTFLADFRARAAFTRLQVKDQPAQESSDDLRISSSASLPGMKIPLGPKLRLMPYGEVLFDSEFTAAEGEEVVPRQADLSFALGLSAGRWGPLRRFRLGVLTQRDLAITEKPIEWGARVEAETWVGFGPRLAWTCNVDMNIYGNTLEQDESDLRFKTILDSRLSLPLARWLSLALYGQSFIFQGRVEQTQDVGATFTAGLAIDLVGAFEL